MEVALGWILKVYWLPSWMISSATATSMTSGTCERSARVAMLMVTADWNAPMIAAAPSSIMRWASV